MDVRELWSTGTDPELVWVTTSGEVSAVQLGQATRTIGRVMRRHHVAGTARVRISAPPCAGAPVLVQVNLDYRGVPVRAQTTGPGGYAVTFAAERLDRQLTGLAGGTIRPQWPGPSRTVPAAPSESRAIVRHKEFALLTGPVDAAAAMLEAMDYEAHLFTEVETGMDAVIHRGGPFGLRLIRQQPRGLPESARLPLTVHPRPTARLDEGEAAHRLCRYGLPYLFFTDPRDERGRLIYRRYDGDLAVLAPA